MSADQPNRMPLAGRAVCECQAPSSRNDARKLASCAMGVLQVSLLTGGGDKPYALGMGAALTSAGVGLDFIGSDELDVPELRSNPRLRFLNLRGDQRPNVGRWLKTSRILRYYAKLLLYACAAKPKIFHILWNNKFQWFDCTLLMLYYRLLGKRVVFTAHNVNAGKRDGNDSWLNRFTLRAQYQLSDHIFVHTEKMKAELLTEFDVPGRKVTVIPFGINKTVPNTSLTGEEARRQLGIGHREKVLLFFGNIAPYKGVEYLVSAFTEVAVKSPDHRLIIVGRAKGSAEYWAQIEQAIAQGPVKDRIIQKIEFVPDEATELYFKAADALVLPYTHVFQSGVLSLAYNFGVPVIAADVGSLKEEIIEGETGFVFQPKDSKDLARKIQQYFQSPLYRELDQRRERICEYADERYSWNKVAAMTESVYRELLKN